MAAMVTGPDHEYVYLKRLITRINRKHKQDSMSMSNNFRLDEKKCNKLKKKLLSSKGISNTLRRDEIGSKSPSMN